MTLITTPLGWLALAVWKAEACNEALGACRAANRFTRAHNVMLTISDIHSPGGYPFAASIRSIRGRP
eukprot:COSAG04_NODE_10405_length_779_cov_1.867647_1_plen_66_part_10